MKLVQTSQFVQLLGTYLCTKPFKQHTANQYSLHVLCLWYRATRICIVFPAVGNEFRAVVSGVNCQGPVVITLCALEIY